MVINAKMHCRVLREQWIRAKYERREFMALSDSTVKLSYLSGHKEGYMEKKGKDEKKFNRRKFVLDEKSNKLAYFIKDDVSFCFESVWKYCF